MTMYEQNSILVSLPPLHPKLNASSPLCLDLDAAQTGTTLGTSTYIILENSAKLFYFYFVLIFIRVANA